jgi:hypothetical protein
MPLRTKVPIGGVRLEAYPVQHSIRAPAVGYRVSASAVSFFYVPDVAWLPNASDALYEVNVYIGDGATMKRSMVRKKNGVLFGHAPITAQLGWCKTAKVHHAIFTHCGSEIVKGDARRLNASVRRLGDEHGIDAHLACDGEQVVFPGAGQCDRTRGMLKLALSHPA